MAPRVLEYKLTAALRTLREVAQALESVLESRGEKKNGGLAQLRQNRRGHASAKGRRVPCDA